MVVWASPDDEVVPMETNAAELARRVEAAGGQVKLHTASGPHGDPSHYDAEPILDFLHSLKPCAAEPGEAASSGGRALNETPTTGGSTMTAEQQAAAIEAYCVADSTFPQPASSLEQPPPDHPFPHPDARR